MLASSTGARSPGEALTTPSTSAVAVRCSSFVTLGFTLGKLTLQICDDLLGIG
jgi:hypothetical protein